MTEFCALADVSDNTNSNAATNGQSLHTPRHWFVGKNSLLALSYSVFDAARHPPKEADPAELRQFFYAIT
jgi:hypothetical protein